MANHCCLITFERRGIWAVGVRRHLPRKIRLCETRTLNDCRLQLAQSPESLLLIEATPANLGGMLELTAEVSKQFPLARVVAVAQRGCESLEWPLREAGAIHFTTSPRDAAVLARMAARHAARLPAPHLSFAAQIWESLPWQDVRGAS